MSTLLFRNLEIPSGRGYEVSQKVFFAKTQQTAPRKPPKLADKQGIRLLPIGIPQYWYCYTQSRYGPIIRDANHGGKLNERGTAIFFYLCYPEYVLKILSSTSSL